MKAKLKTDCFICSRIIRPGNDITKARSGKFVHEACGRAAQELTRSRALINGGYSYAGRKPSEWRIGASPSDGARELPLITDGKGRLSRDR